MNSLKISLFIFLLFFAEIVFSQNVVTYSNLSQTVTTEPGQEVSVKVMASCTGGSANSVLINPTYCVFDSGLKSISFSNGTYLLPGQKSEITFKFKKTVSSNEQFTYKFSTNSSCSQPDSQMIKITVNYTKGNPSPPPPLCNLPIATGVKVDALPRSLSITWDKVPGALSYSISYRSNANGTTVLTSNLICNSTTCTQYIYNLEPNTEYFWKFRAECKENPEDYFSGNWAQGTTVTPACTTLPPSVENLSIVPFSYGYKIDFTPIVDAQYNLEYVDLDTNSSGVIGQFNLLPAGATYPNFYYIQAGHSFKIRIIAYSNCASTYSNWIIVNGLCPIAPSGLYVYNNSFNWNLVTNSQNYQGEYLIYNLSGQNISGFFNGSNNIYSTSINTNEIVGNKFVKFRVKSQCSNGSWSDFSDWSTTSVWKN